MPIFYTFADYDKWHRTQQLKRLRRLQGPEAPNSIVAKAAAAGDASIASGRTSLQDGSNNGITSDGLSGSLSDGLATPATPRTDNPSPALVSGADPSVGVGIGASKTNSQASGGSTPGPSPSAAGNLEMVTGDAATYLNAADVTHPSSTTELTISFWIDCDIAESTNGFLYDFGGITGFETQILAGLDGFILNARGEASSFAISWQQNSSLSGSGPHHVMMRAKYGAILDDGAGYVDGVQEHTDTSFSGSAFSGWTNLYIGANTSGTSILRSTQRMGDLWIGAGIVSNPVGVFIDANGNPLAPTDAATGEYGGITPWVWFSGLENFNNGTNLGSGGGTFSKTGNDFALAESIAYAG